MLETHNVSRIEDVVCKGIIKYPGYRRGIKIEMPLHVYNIVEQELIKHIIDGKYNRTYAI